MFCKVLRAKIHRATVTETDPDYVGSITIDEDLLRATGIKPNEVVLIADCENGARFETYVVKGKAGSGIIGINGAAARLVNMGDKVIIFAHLLMHPDQVDDHYANVVLVGEDNQITRQLQYPSTLEENLPV
ncbi:MAG: aspartate 1-decarboxylase [Phycisphaeraceae bacterium]